MSSHNQDASHDLGRALVRERVRGKLFGDASAPTAVHVGRFELRDKLGEGAMGVVYRAYDPELAREVALKVVRSASLASDDAGDERLLREAQAMARLTHPNVVAVHEVGRHTASASGAGGVFIAMELVDGGTLRSWCLARPSEHEAIATKLIDAGKGLSAAHERGLIHRDFKPENVLIGHDGRPRVVDFGLVTATAAAGGKPSPHAQQGGQTTSGGTPRYMSPEQWRGEYCDSLSDQFNFCVALYEALFGQPPFPDDAADRATAFEHGPAPVSTHPAADLLPAIRRGLSPAPVNRYPTMAALLAELEAALRRRRAKAKRRRTLMILAPLLVLIAAGTAWATWPHDESTRETESPSRNKRASKKRKKKQATAPPNLYAELVRLSQLGKYDECIALTRKHEPTGHLLILRIECASAAGHKKIVTDTCTEYTRLYGATERPLRCTPTYERAQKLYENGKYSECIDEAEAGAPDIMLIVLMYKCAAELRDRNIYRRVCLHASKHFPAQYPPSTCPPPL